QIIRWTGDPKRLAADPWGLSDRESLYLAASGQYGGTGYAISRIKPYDITEESSDRHQLDFSDRISLAAHFCLRVQSGPRVANYKRGTHYESSHETARCVARVFVRHAVRPAHPRRAICSGQTEAQAEPGFEGAGWENDKLFRSGRENRAG